MHRAQHSWRAGIQLLGLRQHTVTRHARLARCSARQLSDSKLRKLQRAVEGLEGQLEKHGAAKAPGLQDRLNSLLHKQSRRRLLHKQGRGAG